MAAGTSLSLAPSRPGPEPALLALPWRRARRVGGLAVGDPPWERCSHRPGIAWQLCHSVSTRVFRGATGPLLSAAADSGCAAALSTFVVLLDRSVLSFRSERKENLTVPSRKRAPLVVLLTLLRRRFPDLDEPAQLISEGVVVVDGAPAASPRTRVPRVGSL